MRFAKKRILQGTDQDTVDRFKREVRLLAKLDHPNIVKVVGMRLEEEPLWFVMPLYANSLEDCLHSITADQLRIQTIFSAILDAIEYAHSEGVIHRDLKPGNVLLNGADDIVVSDFGLGRSVDSDSTRRTGTGDGMGTPLYVAPEQWGDTKRADERADIFSLGRILYELLTGPLTTGFQDTSGIDPALALIVTRCTRKDPDQRFQSVSELKTAWRVAIGEEDAGSDTDRLKSRLTGLLSSVLDTTAAKDVMEILRRHFDDHDLVHNALIVVPKGVFKIFGELDLEFTRALLTAFVQHVATQSWPFSHTDKIGDACQRAFEAIADPESRIVMLQCAASVGLDYNRWHVQAVAADLVAKISTPAERIALAEAIKRERQWFREWVTEKLPEAKRDAVLKEALRCSRDS